MISMEPDRTRWTGYSGALQAVLDEYKRAVGELAEVLSGFTQEQYEATTTLSDETFPDMRAIGEHVAGCTHVYVDYIEDAVDGTDRGRRQHNHAYDTPTATIRSIWQGFDRMAELLGRVRTYTDEDMEKIEFIARWGERYNMAQMLEHAIVHILRHRRQIERWRRTFGV
jgi:uncharacterized damage-inducible protein DinB